MRISPSSTSTSCVNASASVSISARSARRKRYSGRSPAVSGEPSSDGANCGNDGFDAASRLIVSGPGVASTAYRVAARMDALHGPASIVDDQCLALEAGRVGPEPEIDDRLDSLP